MNLGKFHIHRHRSALCHTSGGVFVNFDDAAGANPGLICEDCRLRYRNITGTDIKKNTIDKPLLRATTEYYEHFNICDDRAKTQMDKSGG